jgi:hypothetical protein
MRHVKELALLGMVVLFGGVGCGSQAQEQRTRPADRVETRKPDVEATKKGAPPKPLSADADAPTGEPRKDQEKRGNTPPGTDRAGNPPAAGAIADPQGATQK